MSDWDGKEINWLQLNLELELIAPLAASDAEEVEPAPAKVVLAKKSKFADEDASDDDTKVTHTLNRKTQTSAFIWYAGC